ncbi:response regulator [Pseudomonas sp. WS 5018]|jgi:two-component system sensor histidine kinase BarA|nr:response regulator [Stutzerimonas stutzeri]NMY64384.1 response regulator [Pseudomonas sp. WS 5018]RAA00688.1 hybrid sensor histidine kinase/response regulator [Stutzerimonas stutzeri]RRV62968.1 response regulator [Stutzerimonas stutzeri]RTM24037.1 response regulator [Stutzerimonas stutzeri]TGY10131.1 response regulator [Stutzerimonas stutzeri]
MDVLKDLGIRGRVLMLTLLPSTLLAVVLGAYFTWMQLSEMRLQLDERGQLIAEQLAPLAAPAMNLGYDKRLQRILTQVLDQADVRAVTILDPERVQRVHAGPRMLTPPPPGDPEGLTRVSSMDHTRILMPVLSRHLNLADEARGPEEKLIGWLELELSHHNTLLRGYRSLLTSLFLVGTGLIITALLALRMSRAISLPLQRVKAAVAQLKDGHLETRLPPLGSHEMDELASGINRMAEALLSAREELQQSIDQATEDVQQNLETIEIQNIELDLARKEALEASRIKSEFLANMSHEIRTPLNGILGFTQLLQKSDLTPRQQDYLGTIEKSADSLLGIINEILDFSKIEAGKLVLDTIPFNLRDLIEDTLTILAPAAHTKQLELVSLVYRDTPLSLVGDPLRLKQVLTNLISNAIKFTNEGTIAVRAMVEDDNAERAQLRISVQDTGIGLTDQDLRALFQAFSQADNSMSRQPGGTGLGLVISKRLIEQMGGEIGVDSIPDEGSEFWISLSLPKARDDAEDLPHPALQGRRIALLEQHPLARQALQHQLHSLGLEVQTFDTLDQMQSTISARRQSSELIDLAVLGVTNREIEPQALSRRLAEIEALGCKCVVLCPTTEQASYHDALPEAHSYTQLQGKPACTRKLQRVLVELVRPNQAYAEPAAAAPSRAAQVLCVDDNPANLLLVKTLLGDMGADVVAVDNGPAALEAVKQHSFDLVLMDVQMPGMDGRQTTEAIRQWEQASSSTPLPIVALTAHALANEKRSLLQSGLDDYLTKPISDRQLAQVVLKWTGLALRSQPQRIAEASPTAEQSLKVLDQEEGLRLAAGKADLADDMLGMLLQSLEGDRRTIREARLAGDRQALIERVHRLHGATRYCGVPQLRNACQQSETLLKQNHPDSEAALDELDAAIGRLEQEIHANG